MVQGKPRTYPYSILKTLACFRTLYVGHTSTLHTCTLCMCVCVCACVCVYIGGSRTAGGQKLRWNDMVLWDLRSCALDDNWRDMAQNHPLWQRVIKRSVRSLNRSSELEEKRRKNERKHRREQRQMDAEAALRCDHPGCTFVAVNCAGLANHKRQKHVLVQVFSVGVPSINKAFITISVFAAEDQLHKFSWPVPLPPLFGG